MWCKRRTSILCRENKEQESEGKKQGMRRAMDTLVLFENKLYWNVANLHCGIKFCCTAMWLSYTHKKYIFHYYFSCGLSLKFEYSSLRSTVGLCCFSFLCISNSQSSTHHTLPHSNLVSWPSLVLDELSYIMLLRKPLDIYQKREIIDSFVLGLDTGGSHW